MASKFERGELSQAEEDAETLRRREEDAALFREAGTAGACCNCVHLDFVNGNLYRRKKT